MSEELQNEELNNQELPVNNDEEENNIVEEPAHIFIDEYGKQIGLTPMEAKQIEEAKLVDNYFEIVRDGVTIGLNLDKGTLL